MRRVQLRGARENFRAYTHGFEPEVRILKRWTWAVISVRSGRPLSDLHRDFSSARWPGAIPEREWAPLSGYPEDRDLAGRAVCNAPRSRKKKTPAAVSNSGMSNSSSTADMASFNQKWLAPISTVSWIIATAAACSKAARCQLL